MFFLKSPNAWIDVGIPEEEMPLEIELVGKKPQISKAVPILDKPIVITKKEDFQADEDVLLLLLTEMDKFDD